jgi:hypothetical protein
LHDAVDAGITYAQGFAEWEAAQAADLDLERWENGGYPTRFMAKVLAWYQLHNLVKLHSEEAASTKAQGQAKRNSGRSRA